VRNKFQQKFALQWDFGIRSNIAAR